MPSYSGVFTLQAQMQAKAANNWPSAPLVIGQAYQGGYYAGQISTTGNGIADFNLVIGPVASAESTLQWKLVNTATAGTSSVINGPANSTAMNNITHPAAQFCKAVSAGSYSDWYMPATNELEVCYYNFKPSTQSNFTSSGINANAVPARASNYTTGTPAQTTAAIFVASSGAESFSNGYYWASTEQSTPFANQQTFSNGKQYYTYKYFASKVRAVRRVAV